MSKYEKLIEYIINDEQDKARALFHTIVVEKSRKIYEGLMDEEVGGNASNSFVDEIQDHEDTIEGDEVGVQEDEFDDEEGAEDFGGGELAGDDMGGDELAGDDMGGDELAGEEGEGSVEDRVMDLEAALDELKAEFDELMAGEEAEEDNFPGIHDAEGDDTNDVGGAGADEFDGEEESDFDSEDEDQFGESLVREYIEQVNADPFKNGASEGDAVGSGGKKSPINSKSVNISGTNNMGGSTKNIARGGSESNPDGTSATAKPSNEYTKGQSNLKGAGKFENVPGANTKGYQSKEKAKDSEGATTKDSLSVDKKSFNPGGKPGFKG